MAKQFGSDDIEARLGRRGERVPRASVQTEETSTARTLIVGAVCILVAGGAGAFFASGASAGLGDAVLASVMTNPPKAKSDYVSRVAEACDKGWKDDRINRDQIHCWLTRDAFRLCDPRERQVLADKLVAYHAASERFEGRLTVAALGMMANKPGAIAMGVADARSRDPNLTPEQRQEQMNKVMDMSQDFMAPATKIMEESDNKVSATALLADMKSLAERGYFSAADVTSTMPDFVSKGVAAAGKPTMKCS